MCNLNFIKLKDIVSFRSGKGIKCVGFDSTSTVKVYGANGVIGYTTNALINSPSIIVGRVGVNCGEVIYVNENCWVSDNAIICALDNENFDLMFIYYYLKCLNLNKLKGGSAQPLINQDILGNILVPIFSKHVQESIIALLSSFDKKISVNKQINKDLEELSQTLYTKWFINFDFPNEEGKPYKSSGGEMVESELGLVPKGWNVEVVQNLLSISYGKNLPKNKFKKNGFKVYGANGVVGFYDEFMFEDCTVICGCRGTVGNVYMTTKKSFITNNSLIFSSECLPNEFVYFGLKNLIPKVISGSVQKQITVEAFNGLNFLLPENKVLNDFKSITNPLFEMINSNIKENDYLSKLRDTILPYLMNGTIKIK